MSDAARSTVINVTNNSKYNLRLITSSQKLPHGEWITYPPDRITKNSTPNGPGHASWETDSDGFMTGTEGECSYSFTDDDEIYDINIKWDNPFSGENTYSIHPDNDLVRCTYTADKGNNASVTFTIENGSNHN